MKLAISTALIFIIFQSLTAMASGPLRAHPTNPRYFTDDSGDAIYLTGSHVWNNLRDFSTSDPPARFDYDAYLNFLALKGHNFFRLWAWELTHFTAQGTVYFTDPFPWPRTGPGNANDGKPKFDVSQFNQAYFDRLRARVIAAGDRGIYVSVMLFDGYALQFYRSPLNDGFPLDATNNINGIDAPGTSANTLDDSAVTAVQEAYVKRVIDTVNDLDNVLFEISNEAGPYSTAWQYHMINVVKSYEATKPKQHPVGMTFQYSGGTNSTLLSSSADWISPNDVGGYKDNPPIPNGTKVIVSDTDHLWGEGGDSVWVWKSFTRGLNTLFMDGGIITFPASSDGRESARNAMGHTLTYAQKMDLASAVPQSSSTVCSTNYCLINTGKQYLVFQPSSGAFTLDVAGGAYAYEWFNPASGMVASSGTMTLPSGSRWFTPPFSGSAVLYLTNVAPGATRPAPPTNLTVQ